MCEPKGVLYVSHSKNETSKRPIPLNKAARDAIERMLKRADELGHTDPTHYLWCASQHHKIDPTKPALNWHTAWHAWFEEFRRRSIFECRNPERGPPQGCAV
jgi:hypothetical protein